MNISEYEELQLFRCQQAKYLMSRTYNLVRTSVKWDISDLKFHLQAMPNISKHHIK